MAKNPSNEQHPQESKLSLYMRSLLAKMGERGLRTYFSGRLAKSEKMSQQERDEYFQGLCKALSDEADYLAFDDRVIDDVKSGGKGLLATLLVRLEIEMLRDPAYLEFVRRFVQTGDAGLLN